MKSTLLRLALVALLTPVISHAQAAPTAPATAVEKEQGAALTLPSFEVRSDKDEGYLSTQTTSGSRTVEMLRDVPATISVMNRQLMEDLNITTVDELSEYAVTGHISDDTQGTNAIYIFRGMNTDARLLNGVKSYGFQDAYAMERVEALRGSSAFIYGEAAPGGAMNQMVKAAHPTNFQRLNLLFGSYDMHRAELDVNRRINDKMAVRVNVAYQDANGFVNHTKRKFWGVQVAYTYRPFKDTEFLLSLERNSTRATRADGILADAFSTTQLTGATQAYTATTGGRTFIPALNQTFNMAAAPAQRRSTGTNTAVFDQNILPREANYWGPNSFHNMDALNLSVRLSQRVGENLTLQGSWTHYDLERDTLTNAGSSANAVYLDRNPTLPGGMPNPYFDQYYTEYYASRREFFQVTADARITAIYRLKLPFTEQKIIANAIHQYDIPGRREYQAAEFFDPASSEFIGTLSNEETLAAYRANLAVLNNNRFYRRFYLSDGDGAQYTNNTVIPGRTRMIYDIPFMGTNGVLSHRKFETPALSLGLSGSYFNNRLRTLAGARRDWFYQTTFRKLYNPFTDQEFSHPDPQSVKAIGDVSMNSKNYGLVYHVTKYVAATANYAQSQNVSSGTGTTLIPGVGRGRARGETFDYSLRWALLGGKLESNWTYFTTRSLNGGGNPAVPNPVKLELAAIFDINQSGNDKQGTESNGFEIETIANLTSAWRLMWNFSSTELSTINRYPQLHGFQAEAKAMGMPTPETDAFLPTVPEGTPIPGYTKYTSNLVTSYRFVEGRLKGATLGGGFQYRDKTYRGNFDFGRDGVAEMAYTPAYVLVNLNVGYRARAFNRPTTFNLTVNNVLDKTYFKSRSIGAGSWGEPRSFRFAIRTDL